MPPSRGHRRDRAVVHPGPRGLGHRRQDGRDPNWAPLDEIVPVDRKNDWAVENQLDDTLTLLYSGTLGLKHNPALLVALAREVRDQGKDVRLVVVNEGPAVEVLRAEAERLDVPLTLLPFQPYDRLPEVLGSGDILLVLLEQQAGAFSVPSKTLSYLCAGRPILGMLPSENLAADLIDQVGGHVAAPNEAALPAAADWAVEVLSDVERRRGARRGRARAGRERVRAVGVHGPVRDPADRVRPVTAMATQQTTAVTTVVLGPKTRLGSALLAGADPTTYAVARDDSDRAELASCGATVIDAHTSGPMLDTRPSALRIHVCALGPVHPETARPEDDASFVDRDLDLVARLLGEADGREAHVVLVSSILALAPAADRAYYAGWKNVVEAKLASIVAAHPGGRLSVLYPGRLLAAEERTKPWHRMHTTFERLATLMTDVSEGPARSRTVGLDARIWLMTRSASLVVTSLSGSRRTRERDEIR